MSDLDPSDDEAREALEQCAEEDREEAASGRPRPVPVEAMVPLVHFQGAEALGGLISGFRIKRAVRKGASRGQ